MMQLFNHLHDRDSYLSRPKPSAELALNGHKSVLRLPSEHLELLLFEQFTPPPVLCSLMF